MERISISVFNKLPLTKKAKCFQALRLAVDIDALRTDESNMNALHQEIDERSKLAGNNKLELLPFRLGTHPDRGHSELYGINVFKIREIVPMPAITKIAGADSYMAGVVNIPGQIIPVIDLPAVVGTHPEGECKILLITEFARTTQAFVVETVEEIVRLDWTDVLPLDSAGSGDVVAIARIDGNVLASRSTQLLDVETILRRLGDKEEVQDETTQVMLDDGAVILTADDLIVARSINLSKIPARNRIALVLNDLEMPEMDGFTLTRLIKEDTRFNSISVLIHSSLSGSTNEAHVKRVGADGYVEKFNIPELSAAIQKTLRQPA